MLQQVVEQKLEEYFIMFKMDIPANKHFKMMSNEELKVKQQELENKILLKLKEGHLGHFHAKQMQKVRSINSLKRMN